MTENYKNDIISAMRKALKNPGIMRPIKYIVQYVFHSQQTIPKSW